MQARVVVSLDDDLRVAAERLIESGLRAVPVSDATGSVLGFLDERALAKAWFQMQP
jgi:CBS domain-containing protein